ncbi:MAG: feruloyl-CoA synthase [Rhizobiaceae bacterium]
MNHFEPDNGEEISALFAEPQINSHVDKAGTIYLSNPLDLPIFARCVGDWLVKWAAEKPDTVFLADKFTPDNSWRKITYQQALTRVAELAGWLLETGADTDRPIAILSDNAIDHALLAFAGMHVGIPVATVSTAYSLASTDYQKLKAMIELLDPGVIFVSDLTVYGAAISAIADIHTAQLLASALPEENGFNATLFTEARKPENSAKVAGKFANIGLDTTARLLFTSGSTGAPKAVVNTHRMLTSNQEANLVIWPFLKDTPPVIVDWLPWSHTFGCNFTMNLVLRNGGTMYIDDGKPAPPLIHKTIQNFKEIHPTMCFNVPRGYEILLDALESDAEFRDVFFDMDLIFYAAAALPKTVWDQLIKLSIETTGHMTPLVAAWGSTETAPLATSCHFQAETTGNIGLPIPGTELKLIPNGDKLEVRVKGPNVTLGYYKNDEKTLEAFDDEGFYIMGDAVRFANADAPEKGLFFDGRVSEDFKLSSGTWVSVGELRVAGIDALTPIAQDIVVTGHNRNEIGFLIFPNEIACRRIAEAKDDVLIETVLADKRILAMLDEGLRALQTSGGGSSRYATRARFLTIPPNQDKGEITDKAYLNQRQILSNREADVNLLQGHDSTAYTSLKR